MAEIVNLRHVRKAKARADRERQADANRAAHGRTREQKHLDRISRDRAAAFVDGHRREREDEPTPGTD